MAQSYNATRGGGGVTWLKRLALFWYDFIVGDDWWLAAGVVLALGLGGLASHHGLHAGWFVVPTLVILTLVASLKRALRPDRGQS
jgi:hypothetical protein